MSTDVEEPMMRPDLQIATWLDQASPPVTADDEKLAAHLVTMTVTTTRRPDGPARRRKGIAAAILTPVFLLGGAGAAYAATTIDWSVFWGSDTTTKWDAWAQHPDATITYTLPGGGSCEMRLGEFEFGSAADPNSVDAIIGFLRSPDVLADSDVDGVIRKNRSDQNSTDDGSGTQVPFGYGTDNYNADVEYNVAVKEAVQGAIFAHLDALGIRSTGLTYRSQDLCTGMTQ